MYVVAVIESEDGIDNVVQVVGEGPGTPFANEDGATAAAMNLLFQGRQKVHVAVLEEFAPFLGKRFIIEATGAGGKTVCYGPSSFGVTTFPTREEAEDAAKGLVPGGGHEPPGLEPVTATKVLEVTQSEAEAWTIEGIPE